MDIANVQLAIIMIQIKIYAFVIKFLKIFLFFKKNVF